MSKHRPDSVHIQHIFDLLDSIRGKPCSPSERQKNTLLIASEMLTEANRTQTWSEKRRQNELAKMMDDPRGKTFTTAMTDQCFRSHNPRRIANQLVYLLNLFGVPRYLSIFKRFQLAAFQILGKGFSFILVPLASAALRRQTATVILPGEEKALAKHMQKRRKEGVRLNLNHLGEAILGEKEALRRLNVYLNDLAQDNIEYVSIKISTIFSQINLLSWDHTLEILADRLRQLYRVAKAHVFVHIDGRKTQKFVNLDMEEYRDLHLTVALFKKVLSEPEFHDFSAGIVLQAYLPDAHEIQKELTDWAMERVKKKGAPIKIRIVKGANLAMEQFEASLRDWPQAPYTKKSDVDANYKRMVLYGAIPAHAKAVRLGIASHNLFDIAFAMVLRAEYDVGDYLSFEMLEGMADHIRRVVQKVGKEMLLYCPVATKQDFQSAIAYLIRRLDENTGPDNFLRHTFGLKPNTLEWDNQASLFVKSCEEMSLAPLGPRRDQNRLEASFPIDLKKAFENEADTDFSLLKNRTWVHHVMQEWKKKTIEPICSVINGEEIDHPNLYGNSFDPANRNQPLYQYTLLPWDDVDRALEAAVKGQKAWAKIPIDEKCAIFSQAAQKLRQYRGDLIGTMMADGGKIALESDPEISEAIDFAEYYRRSLIKMHACLDLEWTPKGVFLVASPWNFPVSIPAGGIFAALAMGNSVIFKPAPEAVLSGWMVAKILWEAGVPKEALHFINCVDDPVGSQLIQDKRLSGVILTGATSTARLFLNMRPGLDLYAETGGKNSLIITAMADRDLAIKDLITSAFGHSGQKCSAASLAILEAEVYDDPHFQMQLKDAVESLSVGPAWHLSSKVVPLIQDPGRDLLRGLTTLDEGEAWLVKPKKYASNLWSPGVKYGVKEGSFMHQTELFGPVLGVMRAKNLDHAIELANGNRYGLTSGLHSLDEREHHRWLEKIEAGNLYINRTTTGAIVRRQPFGGCKDSGYGLGAKAGGPNFISQFAHPRQRSLPQEKSPVSPVVEGLTQLIQKLSLSPEELGTWYASISNYSFWANRFLHDHDPSKLIGQDNLFRYRPYKGVVLRIQKTDAPLDILRVCAAALSVKTNLEISWETSPLPITEEWEKLMPCFRWTHETTAQFLQRLAKGSFKRVRLLSPADASMQASAAFQATHLSDRPVLASGRFELLHYLREVAISIDYHRYGNLGTREGAPRKKIS